MIVFVIGLVFDVCVILILILIVVLIMFFFVVVGRGVYLMGIGD